MPSTVRALRFDANQRPRGHCLITLEWRGRTITAVSHQERRYLPTGRTATRITGESVIEMMARNYFVERLWLSTDGTALWEQQPLAL
jgi:hypothetical protein